MKIHDIYPQIPESTRNLRIGDRLIRGNVEYLIACVGPREVCLINPLSGTRWSNMAEVKSMDSLSYEEVCNIIGWHFGISDWTVKFMKIIDKSDDEAIAAFENEGGPCE